MRNRTVVIKLAILTVAISFLVISLVWRAGVSRAFGMFAFRGSNNNSGPFEPAGDPARDVLIAARNASPAPELSDGTWINTKPLKVDELRGRVVIVDFWTFGCYNCRNTLPTLKRWDARYRDKGLTIIGVHTPESEYEKSDENVRRAVRDQGILYPVVTDAESDTWRAYGIEAWPTTILLDKKGRIRFTHIGEGYYDQMEGVIKKLLAEEPLS